MRRASIACIRCTCGRRPPPRTAARWHAGDYRRRFTRFGRALARHHQGTTVCEEAAEECGAVQRVPLASVDLDPDVRERLLALGIETVGDFLRLPADGIRQRFGAETDLLYQLASGHRWAPLVPVPPQAPHERLVHFDSAESHTDRLIFIVKRLLDSLLAALMQQAHAVLELELEMKLDDRTIRTERVRASASTIDGVQLLALVRLRLEALRLPAGIVTLRITAASCPASSEQRRLFPHYAQRDPDLANQAFARLRAEFGEESVVHACLGNGHLPAAQFTWERLDHVPLRASPRIVASRLLVRRIYPQPVALPSGFGLRASGSRRAPGSRLRAPAEAPEAPSPQPPVPSPESPAPSAGPFVVSGGWWSGGIRRDYYFTPTENGNLGGCFDHRRQQFYLRAAWNDGAGYAALWCKSNGSFLEGASHPKISSITRRRSGCRRWR